MQDSTGCLQYSNIFSPSLFSQRNYKSFVLFCDFLYDEGEVEVQRFNLLLTKKVFYNERDTKQCNYESQSCTFVTVS